MADEEAPRHTSRRRRAIVWAVAPVVILGLALAVVHLLGGWSPSHYVSVSNNTGEAISWSCSWSNLDLQAGATGRIRILDQPDEDFGCITSPDTSNDVTCPDVGSLAAGRSFTATGWIRQFPCP